jgi:hypothetical protein
MLARTTGPSAYLLPLPPEILLELKPKELGLVVLRIHEVLQRAAQPVNRPGHKHIEFAARAFLSSRSNSGAFVAGFGAAHLIVDVEPMTAGTAASVARLDPGPALYRLKA